MLTKGRILHRLEQGSESAIGLSESNFHRTDAPCNDSKQIANVLRSQGSIVFTIVEISFCPIAQDTRVASGIVPNGIESRWKDQTT